MISIDVMLTKYAVALCAFGLALPAVSQTTVAKADIPAAKPENNVRIIEQIVAKINNEIVTLGELERQRKSAEAEMKRQQMPPEQARQTMQEVEKNLLRDKIDQILLVQKAKDLDIKVDTELNKYLAQIQLETKITDPDKFQTLVREQTGMAFEDYKQQIKDDMLKQQVIRREVGSRINIPSTELKKYYDDHKNDFVRDESVILREILISTQGKDAAGAAAAEKKAKDIVTRARKAEPFATLAKDNSDDAETARSGGELPQPFKRGMLKKEIEDVVFKQGRGYVTDPIKTTNPDGFLILKVEEHYQAGVQPYEAVENEIMDKLYMPRLQPALRSYLTKLRQDAFLEIRAGYVDSGAAPGKDTSWRDPAKLTPQTVTKEEVASRTRRKRLLWAVPVPGTQRTVKSTSK